ncbi:MAG: hypothetical protein KF863_21340 [Rubrivivax sp.]|nr:hypothetical protein [Rubrivivax sp.]
MAAAGIALALSLAGNAVLTWAYLGQRDAATRADAAATDAIEQRDGAREVAEVCSRSVERAAAAAADAQRRAAAAQAVAAAAARRRLQLADDILAAPPAVPGDDCASARVRVDRWLSERTKP